MLTPHASGSVLHAGSNIGLANNYLGGAGFGAFSALRFSAEPFEQHSRPRYYLGIEVGEACQLKCRHCIYHRPKSGSPRPSEVVRSRVHEAFADGFDPLWVSFVGKEPTLFPERLLELAEATHRPGRVNILMTNGLKLDGQLVDDIEHAFDQVDVSLDGSQRAHDWMRGAGTFAKTRSNIEYVVSRGKVEIGVIAMAVNAITHAGKPQVDDILELAQTMATQFGVSRHLSLAISLYYGQPGDPLLLRPHQITRLIEGLADLPLRSRVLVTSIDAHQWPTVVAALQKARIRVGCDRSTRLPLANYGNTDIVLFNLTDSPQIAMRVSNDALTYLGCNHLVLGDQAEKFAVSDLRSESIAVSATKMAALEGDALLPLHGVPRGCATCSDWSACRGGDRLSGVYFKGEARDPLCARLNV